MARVVIVGGGVAGLEALLALHDLAGDRAELTLVAPAREFVYRPMLVTEPFDLAPPEHRELAPLAEELGATFVRRAAAAVRPEEHVVELDDGSELAYDHLVVCAGGRFRVAIEDATTFPSADGLLNLDDVLRDAEAKGAIAFVVPPGVSWPLPLYELALMVRRRAVDRGLGRLRFTIVTPEQAPLSIFGPAASAALAKLLAARRIEVLAGTYAHEGPDGELLLTPGEETLWPAAVVALPVIDGPALPGLPSDDGGFIPIDDHARVTGVEDVYAAGDGTSFPIKQGGLGTQQADAAAAHIAHRLGAVEAPEPFHPILRGKLITGEEALHMRTDVTGGAGEGTTSLDSLWWPPHKISGRYLAPWFGHVARYEPDAPAGALDIEVEMPRGWHHQPQLINPYGPGFDG